MLALKPVSLLEANEYVRQNHRHHKPVVGHKFSIGCESIGCICAECKNGDRFVWRGMRDPPTVPEKKGD